jgi:hypothetical protein
MAFDPLGVNPKPHFVAFGLMINLLEWKVKVNFHPIIFG